DGVLVEADRGGIFAGLDVSERLVMERIGPVLRAARGVAESGNGFVELRLFEVSDAERVVAVGGAGIEADGLVQQIRGVGEFFIEQKRTALEEIGTAFEE